MALSRKQKIEERNRQHCLQYLNPDWDGCAAVEYFSNLHYTDIEENYRFKPKTILHKGLMEIEIAQSMLYGVLAPMGFHKEKIVSFLDLLNENNVHVGDEIIDRDHYIKSYLSIAKTIANKIADGQYEFQHPGK